MIPLWPSRCQFGGLPSDSGPRPIKEMSPSRMPAILFLRLEINTSSSVARAIAVPRTPAGSSSPSRSERTSAGLRSNSGKDGSSARIRRRSTRAFIACNPRRRSSAKDRPFSCRIRRITKWVSSGVPRFAPDCLSFRVQTRFYSTPHHWRCRRGCAPAATPDRRRGSCFARDADELRFVRRAVPPR